MEFREPGVDRARVLETSGLICYDQINTRGLVGFCSMQVCLTSELKSPNKRKFSYFDEHESISLLRYSNYHLIMVLWGL